MFSAWHPVLERPVAQRLHLPESECSGKPDGQSNYCEREC
jgi:hypothetical protein